MVRPLDMGPADLAPNTAPPETLTEDQERKAQRNAFFNSLPLEAKEQFLAALTRASEQGLDEESAWRAAVVAAENAYGTHTAPGEDMGAPGIGEPRSRDENL